MYFKCAQCLSSLALNMFRLVALMTAGGSMFQSLMTLTEKTFGTLGHYSFCFSHDIQKRLLTTEGCYKKKLL